MCMVMHDTVCKWCKSLEGEGEGERERKRERKREREREREREGGKWERSKQFNSITQTKEEINLIWRDCHHSKFNTAV